MAAKAQASHGRPHQQRRRLAAALITLFACLATAPARADPASDELTFAARYAAVDSPAAATEPAPGRPAEPPPSSLAAPVRPEAPSSRGDAVGYYRSLIAREAGTQGLAPAIAEAVMAVESGFNPGAIGGAGEIGLMQILPSTARMMGFAGSNAELAVPENNIHYGVSYLAQAWRLAGGDLCTAVMKYRAGHGETRFSYLSVDYCLAVRSKLAARGFPVTGSVPVATFGAPGGGAGAGGCGRKCLGATRVGRVDLAALNTKLSTLVMQVRGGK
jgi:soluble lytic murein transglycosylase-like protein